MYISNHLLDVAIQKPSPNHGGIITPKFVVMHYTAGWTAAGAISTFEKKSSQVSAQLTIDTDGTIYQHVPFNIKAWHAGPSEYKGYTGINSHSIGIELVNPGYLRKVTGGLPDTYMDSTGATHLIPMQHLVKMEYPRVGSGVFYWPTYTEDQLQALEDITKLLIQEYSLEDVTSHEEIDTRGWKTDPGPAFPMNRFKKLFHGRKEDVVVGTKPPKGLRGRFKCLLSYFS